MTRCRAGYLKIAPFIVSTIYPCQTTYILALPAALSGFRLTLPAGPIRVHAVFLGPTGPAYLPSCERWHIQYSRLSKSFGLPNRGSQGVGAINAKTPVVLAGTNRGFRGFLGRRLLFR